jgi:hypothetical protein
MCWQVHSTFSELLCKGEDSVTRSSDCVEQIIRTIIISYSLFSPLLCLTDYTHHYCVKQIVRTIIMFNRLYAPLLFRTDCTHHYYFEQIVRTIIVLNRLYVPASIHILIHSHILKKNTVHWQLQHDEQR